MPAAARVHATDPNYATRSPRFLQRRMRLRQSLREFHRAQTQPGQLVHQPKAPGLSLRDGIDSIIQSILGSQHPLEMCGRSVSDDVISAVSPAASPTGSERSRRCSAGSIHANRSAIGRLCRVAKVELAPGLWARARDHSYTTRTRLKRSHYVVTGSPR